MEPSWTLLMDSEEGSLPDELHHQWNKRGFRIITEEEAATTSRTIHGILVRNGSNTSELVWKTKNDTRLNEQTPFLLLLTGDEIPYGMADQLHEAIGVRAVDVVRLFLFPDGEHAVIGGDLSSDWVRILRQQLADEGVISQICKQIEVDEIAACLPLYLEWKQRFYLYLGERCDQAQARTEVVAWGLGMDKRIGQGWIQDKPLLVGEPIELQPISLKEWLIKEMQLLRKQQSPQTITVWSDERGMRLIEPEIEQLGSIRLYVTDTNHQGNPYITGCFPGFANLQESIRGTDALIILDTNPLIRELAPELFVQTMRKPFILDTCSCYPLQEMEAFQIAYRTIGEKSSKWASDVINKKY